MEVLYLAERRKKKWESERERRADHMKIRRRMGKLLFYCCPLLRFIFAMECWDRKRSVNKLRNDLIKVRRLPLSSSRSHPHSSKYNERSRADPLFFSPLHSLTNQLNLFTH